MDISVIRKFLKVEMFDEEFNASFIKLDGKIKDFFLNFDVLFFLYGVSEILEIFGLGILVFVVRYCMNN